jgi:succinyl-CoA synthetase beta subunit
MNIHEYQAKQLFAQVSIPIPAGKIAGSQQQAIDAAQALGGEAWVVKAQVHAGGRGKAGGVKVLHNLTAVADFTEQLLGTRLVTAQTDSQGLPIDAVLVELPYSIQREFYLSLLVDRASQRLMFVASSAGGMDIEAVAEHTPEKIITLSIHPAAGLQSYQCRKLGFALALAMPQMAQLETIMRGMYQLCNDKDASQIEINPLVETADGELLALDAKINFDDNALALHPDILAFKDPRQEDEKENAAQQFGLNYITLDGNIACMVNGAGLAMATMDLIKLNGGLPANFLDVGGGTNVEKVTAAFKLIVADPHIKAVLVNIFGGIVKCDVIAQGILAAVEQVQVTIPVVVRLEGTNAQAGRDLLRHSKMAVIAADDLASAAAQVVNLVQDLT